MYCKYWIRPADNENKLRTSENVMTWTGIRVKTKHKNAWSGLPIELDLHLISNVFLWVRAADTGWVDGWKCFFFSLNKAFPLTQHSIYVIHSSMLWGNLQLPVLFFPPSQFLNFPFLKKLFPTAILLAWSVSVALCCRTKKPASKPSLSLQGHKMHNSP